MFEMNPIADFLLIVYVISCILGITLFFKVWGMTNNVSRMLEIMEQKNKEELKTENESPKDFNVSVGDKVFIKSKGKESEVIGIKGDKYECSSNNGNFYDGVFDRNDLIKR
jgi:hypothetical protein